MTHATIYRNCLVLEFVGGRDLVLWADDAVEMLTVLLGHASPTTVSDRQKILAEQLLHTAEEPEMGIEETVPYE